jgi:peptidoglycan hydrolase-like protein with peptidoglycan-binding domain
MLDQKTSDVKELQKYINKRLSLVIAVDGYTWTKTFALIKNIQTTLGLPETGIYDQGTRDTINADCLKITTALQKQNSAL